MHVYFSLGTNLGDKEQNLRLAVQHIEERIGKIVSLSAFYATAPWGFTSDNAFLNAAVCAETSLPPLEILSITQSVEREMGRTHKSVNGEYKDRVIDIDLLLCGDLILDTPILKTSPSVDAGTPLCDGAAGGDCARCDASGIGKDTGKYLL